MRAKLLLIIGFAIIFFFPKSDFAFATNWQYVGTLTLSSGEVRKDYVDADSVVYDKNDHTMKFWVLSEIHFDKDVVKSLKRYSTDIKDILLPTRMLEYKTFSENNILILEDKTPSTIINYPEDVSLLGRAIDIAEDYIKK
ncbi:hypothetical protein TDSAC_1354 [Thermodesulfobium acidiphilum]|uniref:Uncharacterized protein n=1 Tax=Thermodesulfobium acidiphilum TaxID=1794699 RepID=A0A2R4W1S7_THEAF|nr:hypothetical protein [Thermodesulfobium acidiphilum]AWB10694.1 hypothetical protein TDSAC_1354 [Thermodesulfobium acidiphilum]